MGLPLVAKPSFTTLDHARIPGYPDAQLQLDGQPLRIVDDDKLTSETDTSDITAAIGVATVLYRWCPAALYAFLDLDSWFSLTWNFTLKPSPSSSPSPSPSPLPDGNESEGEIKFEIGRVRNCVTMGILDSTGEKWKVMVSYVISCESGDQGQRGVWRAEPGESMLDGEELSDEKAVDELAREFVKGLLLDRRWTTTTERGGVHEFFVEFDLTDPFGDGIAMNPHWLYEAMDLERCTASGCVSRESLRRCSRCGTAAYCSDACQRADWAVHKGVCNMAPEERGKALYLTQNGGLVNWVGRSEMVADAQSEPSMSENPHFLQPQIKRR